MGVRGGTGGADKDRNLRARTPGAHPTPDRWVWKGGVHHCVCQMPRPIEEMIWDNFVTFVVRGDPQWATLMLKLAESAMLP